ncbi:MAG: sulfotransferase [Calditrichaeota bacterium]|nr:MAG: sulfotransferase [Calditrichota bacterium]
MPKQFVFLTYLNRSGSTLLAKKLNAYIDIAVSIEAILLNYDKIDNFSINSEVELDKALNELFNHTDKKFIKWEIEKNTLKEKYLSEGLPIKLGTFLTTIFDIYFQNNPAKVHFYKYGHMFKYVERIWKEFPESKLIFIERDPRAIFNSQKVSLDSRSGKPMENDIIKFVRNYKIQQETISRLKNNKHFFLLTFEEMITDEERTLNGVIDFVGASKVKTESNDYFNRIPDQQKHLHQNLKSTENKSDRMHAWKNELSKADIIFMQKVLIKELSSKGYSIERFNNLNYAEKLEVLSLRVKFFFFHSFKYFLLNNLKFIHNFIVFFKNIGKNT